MAELKQAKIENGKICLDGKVIEADLMCLGITRKESISHYRSRYGLSIDLKKAEAEIEKLFREHIQIRAPAQTNAYIVGERRCFDGLDLYFPILYLKIKN